MYFVSGVTLDSPPKVIYFVKKDFQFKLSKQINDNKRTCKESFGEVQFLEVCKKDARTVRGRRKE